MPSNSKNPFIKLGISLDEARRLAQLNPNARRSVLSIRRRWYAGLYHPDRTRDPGDNAILAGYFGSLDALDDPEVFGQSLQEYQAMVGPSSDNGAQSVMLRQAEYLRNQAIQLNEDTGRKLATIGQKDIEIRELKEVLRQVRNEIFELQGANQQLKDNYAQRSGAYRRRLTEHRIHYIALFERLCELAFGSDSIDAPQGTISLTNVANTILYVVGIRGREREPYQVVLRVDEGLSVKREDKTPRNFPAGDSGLLLGSLEKLELDGFTVGDNTLVTARSKPYDAILFNAKPYVGVGTHPVVVVQYQKPQDAKPLYVYGKITDIKHVQAR